MIFLDAAHTCKGETIAIQSVGPRQRRIDVHNLVPNSIDFVSKHIPNDLPTISDIIKKLPHRVTDIS